MAIKGGCAGAFFAAWLLIASPTKADPQAAATALFAAPTVAERSAADDELENADPKDPVVPYALGATQFFQALEGLAMALNRHGFESTAKLRPALASPAGAAARRAGAAHL